MNRSEVWILDPELAANHHILFQAVLGVNQHSKVVHIAGMALEVRMI